ncbi:MAG TPA: hypothetical protein DCZ75_15505 [Geobacter sp.]|nr:hypothetical protein [Geobacter sp.]
MFKPKENPRYHIVSVRVSEEERETLNMLSRQSHKTTSELMREALQNIVPGNRQPQPTGFLLRHEILPALTISPPPVKGRGLQRAIRRR